MPMTSMAIATMTLRRKNALGRSSSVSYGIAEMIRNGVCGTGANTATYFSPSARSYRATLGASAGLEASDGPMIARPLRLAHFPALSLAT